MSMDLSRQVSNLSAAETDAAATRTPRDVAARQRWMGLLARAPIACLREAWERLEPQPAHRRLRGPETGMVMVRGRTGGTGERFNFGEMTVTRCSVVLNSGAADGLIGHAYVAGADAAHAELAAVFDALLQLPAYAADLEATLITPIEADLAARRARMARRAAATRVEFFTMVRGED